MAQTPNDPKSRVEVTQVAQQQRNKLFSKNTYVENSNPYSSNHPNAKSTGDELGRGENSSGQVGTSTDIQKRQALLGKNIFNKHNKYNY